MTHKVTISFHYSKQSHKRYTVMEPARKVYSYMNSVLNSVDLLHIFYNIHKENVPKKKQKNKKDYQKNAYG